MKVGRRGVLIAAVFVVCSGVAGAEEGVASTDALIKGLADADFKTRNNAEEKLVEWGRENLDAGIEKFYRLYRESDDPEIRMRSRNVLRDLVIHKQAGEGKGYLGIRMQVEELMVDGGELRSVVRITQVMPGTPAEKAGLKPNDLILGIDELEVGGNDALSAFGAYVQSQKPRTDVTVHLLRRGEDMDVVVNLMRMPRNLLQQRSFMWGAEEYIPPPQEEVEEEEFREWLQKRRQSERNAK